MRGGVFRRERLKRKMSIKEFVNFTGYKGLERWEYDTDGMPRKVFDDLLKRLNIDVNNLDIINEHDEKVETTKELFRENEKEKSEKVRINVKELRETLGWAPYAIAEFLEISSKQYFEAEKEGLTLKECPQLARLQDKAKAVKDREKAVEIIAEHNKELEWLFEHIGELDKMLEMLRNFGK
jgi:transcriptional regulator with XRE-family HTH domain